MAQRVVVMYAGKIVEQGTVDEIFYKPQHPYTWGLLRSVPRLDTNANEELVPIPGTPPDLFAPPKGCAFAARCPYAMNHCLEEDPAHYVLSDTHTAACWLLHPDAPKVERPVGVGGKGMSKTLSKSEQPILQIRNMKKHFNLRQRQDSESC